MSQIERTVPVFEKGAKKRYQKADHAYKFSFDCTEHNLQRHNYNGNY